MNIAYSLIIFIFTFISLSAFAQTGPAVNELKRSLNEGGTHYIKATFLNQVWLRYNQSNPGSTVQGEVQAETFDIGLRRTRMQLYGQLTDHAFFYFQFGQNNFNFLSQNSGNRKLQAFFHDALGEYSIWKNSNKLKLGAGLTITNGLSRFSQPSISSIATLDVPVFAQATVDQTDEFSRKLSLYARGQLGKLDYRLTVSDPFPVTTNGLPKPVVNEYATFSTAGHHRQYQGCFMVNFLEKEPHTTPYMTGTYLGKKSICNLEAGFIFQRNAMATGHTDSQTNAVSDLHLHDLKLWSVALFYDAPVNKETGSAVNVYSGFFTLDYGPGYLRYNGIMNPADGLTNGLPGAQGNAYPMFGTGKVWYSQVGYLLPKKLLGSNNGTLMPYASWMHASFDRLGSPSDVIDVGLNWLQDEHHSKITLNYQYREIYTQSGTSLVQMGNRSLLMLQYQIFF